MKVKNISPKLSARANYTFSGMTILQHEPAAAPKKVFLPCVSLPRANFYENIFYNAFALLARGGNFEYLVLNRGKDSRDAKGGHWTERSEGSGWSDSGIPDSLFFAKQKATLKIQNFTFVLIIKKFLRLWFIL